MKKQSDIHTKITIFCKDGSTRVINAEGNWTESMAKNLGRDIERDNYWTCHCKIC